MSSSLLPASVLLGLLLAGCTADPTDTGKGGDTGTDLDDTADTAGTDTSDTDTAETGDTGPEEIDGDGDGVLVSAGDCDDTDAAIHPQADETCNDVDDDCDGDVDEAPTDAPTWYGDGDGDGYGNANLAVASCDAPPGFVAEAGDCDDGDTAFHPGAEETCSDAVDLNCDGSIGYADADADGVPACEDCDDADATAFPGADELCDGADDDCDGDVDEDALDRTTFYTDADGDLHGDEATAVLACEAPAGAVTVAGDCDDADAAFNPAATESCTDAVDLNCDGSIGYADADGDGVAACEDCDDADATAFPGAVEACDGDDEDCDGAIDEAGAEGEALWYADVDGDTFGDAATSLTACDAPVGYVADDTDCADEDATAFPGAPETCDDADDDCDGTVDNDAIDLATWYADLDGDLFGDPASAALACDAPANHVANATDCDDGAGAINPSATELCDDADVDEDCDGDSDDDDASVDPTSETEWYIDYDTDGFGTDGRFTVSTCEMPAGYAAAADDCDDLDATVNPGAIEQCDGGAVDEDCDGLVNQDDADAEGTTTYYADVDLDGYGDADATIAACALPTGYAENDDDCDDAAAGTNPAATELCDDADTDEDCDGIADDFDGSATGQTSFYADADGDGYGDASVAASSCDAYAGWVADATDCDDVSATDFPGAAEIVGNADDEDCDGGEVCFDDADNDGFLDTSGNTRASADRDCSDAYEGLATDLTTDCDDTSASTKPGASETCDLADNDCDGTVDEGVGSTFYVDADGDGHGVTTTTTVACTAPSGYASASDDCDDTNAALNPGAEDVCGDGIDQDCDADVSDCNLDGTYDSTSADFVLSGVNSSDHLSRSFNAGDFDGDGQDDLVVGVGSYDLPSTGVGASMVWYGPIAASGTYATADATVTGLASSSYMGYGVVAGDLDGDGADELITAAYGTSTSAGAVYVEYGGSSRMSGSTAASALDAAFTGGASSDYLGYSVASAGDLDGDGLDDLVMGAYGQDGAASSAGAAYVVYGSTSRLSGSAAASTASATFRGVASSDYFGYAVSLVDDMDGDGLDELLVGAYGTDVPASSAGAAYLFLGEAGRFSGTISASTADRTWTPGTVSSDYAGRTVNGLGDLDGDGYGDAGVHGDGYDVSGQYSNGALWIYSGAPTASLPTTATATIYGLASYDYLGEEAYAVGDLDGDGADELVVGAYGNDTSYSSAGAAYLFYGPVSGTLSSSTADATFLGRSGGDGYLGKEVPDRATDLTGDGVPDVVVGGYWDDTTVYDGGAIYIWAGLTGD